MLVGYGYDIHRLESGRPMRLGGVAIDTADSGPVAHSDGDVLLHAVCDALLGAAGLDDIGEQFPDTDSAYRGIDSLELLRRVVAMLTERNLRPHNVDCMVILERPKLAPFRPEMRRRMAEVLLLPVERVTVKATTAEGMGDVGQGLSCVAHAVATLSQAEDA